MAERELGSGARTTQIFEGHREVMEATNLPSCGQKLRMTEGATA